LIAKIVRDLDMEVLRRANVRVTEESRLRTSPRSNAARWCDDWPVYTAPLTYSQLWMMRRL
jgi:hypothetical protein